MKVELVAEDFSIQSDPACFGDYLQLLDGNSTTSPSLGKFCGDRFGPITSTGETLTLLFVTDYFSQDTGFKLFYNFTTEDIHECLFVEWRCANTKCIHKQDRCNGEDDCGDDSDEQHCNDGLCNEDESSCPDGKCISRDWLCDGDEDCKDGDDEMVPVCPVDTVTGSHACGERDIVGVSGIITSVNYPLDYPSNTRCIYVIQAPDGIQNITITFDDNFELELEMCASHPCAHCQADYLRISGSDLTLLTSTHCGDTAPDEIVIGGNTAYIDFSSDRGVEYQGFRLQWLAQ